MEKRVRNNPVSTLSVFLLLCALCVSVVGSCGRDDHKRQVVLYTSCDDYLLREVIPGFEKETGIKVLVVGDTEATKTIGLVQRVLDEKEHPEADVWWSNEPFGTVRLAREGALEPYTSPVEHEFGGHWPMGWRPADGMWYGFAYRARAIVFNTKKLTESDVPARSVEFSDPRWKGRIAMARPQFGTTRALAATLLRELGPDKYRQWVRGLKDNGVRLYDGNSSVVRAAAQGEIEVGLTDTDDVYAGQHEGWPVAMKRDDGTALLPNTVARVRGCRHPAEAAALIDFLLSEKVDRALAVSDARMTPIRRAVAVTTGPRVGGGTVAVDFESIERLMPEAVRIWDEVFGR